MLVRVTEEDDFEVNGGECPIGEKFCGNCEWTCEWNGGHYMVSMKDEKSFFINCDGQAKNTRNKIPKNDRRQI